MNQCSPDGAATIGCLEILFKNFVQSLIAFAAVALFIMLLVGGYKFLFSAGDPKKLESARGTITSAIVGIVIMSLAYLIIFTIQKFTGVNVTQFNITVPQ